MKRLLNKVPYISRSQRIGIITLSILIFLLQIGYFLFLKVRYDGFSDIIDSDKEWLNQQLVLDSINKIRNSEDRHIYPFNPNFITDYKGYSLGMKIEEIDRLHKFRDQDKYVNSAKEFQEVTGVSDELLAKISPYFKYPEWKTNPKAQIDKKFKENIIKPEKIVVRDINLATKEDLMQLRGIGPAFSDRIIREREKFGGFLSMKQLNFVWGLSDESIENLNKYFAVLEKPQVEKININEATVEEISKLPYLNYYIARNIVIYRSGNGDFNKFEELQNIKNFPLDKLKIISLYLTLNKEE